MNRMVVCNKKYYEYYMERESMYILYSTFFIWFLSWTLLEAIMTYYKMSSGTKVKVVAILLLLAVLNYTQIKDTKDDRD